MTNPNERHYWLSRHFRYTHEYRATLVVDALRWPEDRIPRTDNPLDFATLIHRHF